MIFIMGIACNTFWIIYPILDGSPGEKRLPFLAWFPYDYKISPLYELTFVFEILTTNYVTLIHVNTDFIIFGLNVCAGCQFDMLSDNLRNLSNSSCNATKDLVNCIIYHKQILR